MEKSRQGKTEKELYDKARAMLEICDYAKGVEMMQRLAENGYANAQSSLGCCYLFGNGVFQDKGMAAEWFQKAAEQGNEDAQTRLRQLGIPL